MKKKERKLYNLKNKNSVSNLRNKNSSIMKNRNFNSFKRNIKNIKTNNSYNSKNKDKNSIEVPKIFKYQPNLWFKNM